VAEIGDQLATRGCILLTGGTGSADDSVKDCAIRGAERARREGRVAAWVGVERTPTRGAAEGSGSGLILRPGYQHERNYVEAHLCDAAIALPGGPGTASEVAFCPTLKRPLVLVGPIWQTGYGLSADNRAQTVAKLRTEMMTQMRKREIASPWDEAISDAFDRRYDASCGQIQSAA
jgi:predicted Rossmann-fold nucleotide-binding protein